MSWAEGQYYRPLDIAHINESLKYVKYKKTEWQLIDHENYHVLSDKYRGEVAVEKIPNKDLIIHELGQMERPNLKPLPTIPFQVIEGGKVGRNEPCLCGSGKKHKKCCGK